MSSDHGAARIEAFADGVYAIAITLLILEIRVPEADAIRATGLWSALRSQWPSFGAFLLSFAVIGIMWANHHNIFRYIGRTNHVFLMLNLALLLCTAFLPYPTAVLAAYLPVSGERTAATALYGATLTVTATVYNLLWRYASSGNRLLRPDAEPQLVRGITREFSFGPVCYLLATAAAFVNVWVSLAIHAALAALYVLPTPSRP